MKILSVNNTADIYGASRCMERLFGRFVEDGHEVHAVLPKRGPLAEHLESRGIHVHIHKGLIIVDRTELQSIGGCVRLIALFPYSVVWLAFLMLRLRADVVHTNTSVLPTPALAAALTGRSHVWHIRELFLEFKAFWRIYEKYICMFSSVVVAISECTRDQFAPKLRKKVSVVYDGLDQNAEIVDEGQREAFLARFPPQAPLVGIVGRIKWHRKGQEVLVRAAAHLKARFPEVRYVVVGSYSPGNEIQVMKLRNLIAANGVINQFVLTGEIVETQPIFAACDIIVVPSVQPEPLGLVVMEAMAVGTPVIGSRCGGIAEQIIDGVTGLLFEPGDEAELARRLEQLLHDHALRARLGDAGKKHYQEKFTIEHSYRGMLGVLKSVGVSSRRPVLSPEILRRTEVQGGGSDA